MAISGIQPVNFFAGSNPDLYQQQLSLAQRQALAQHLMEQGSEIPSPNQPTNPGGFVPGLSPLTAATGAGKMLAGAMMQKNINKQQADLAGQQMQAMIQMLRGGAQAPQQPQAPQAPTGVSDASATSAGAPWAAASQLPQPTPQPQLPPQAGSVDPGQLMQLYAASTLFGPQAGQFAAKSMEPTDLQKNIQAAGFAPGSPQAAQAYQHTLNPALSTRYGIFSQDPNARYYPAGGALPAGAMPYQFGPGGQVDVKPYPGQVAGAASMAAATGGGAEAGKAPYQFQTVNTEGAPTLMTHQQAIEAATGQPMPQPGQPPPQMGTVPPPQPGTPEYNAFKQVQSGAVSSAYVPRTGGLPSTSGPGQQPQYSGPGLRLQDQGASAEQKSYGTARGALVAEKPIATLAFNDAASNLDRLGQQAQALKDHSGIGRITGIPGALPNVPGMAGADAQAKLDTLKSQAAFTVLQAMRNASKTGGALGQVSDREELMLANNLAALQNSQSKQALQDNLQRIIDWAAGAKARMKNAYDMTYNEAQPAAPAGNKVRVVDW